MMDFLGHLRNESAKFAAVLSAGDLSAGVPSCPDWSLADLGFHLAEVQYFWGSIVGDLLENPERVAELGRPPDEDIPNLFGLHSLRLIHAIDRHEPNDVCWSWHDDGHSVAWVTRRQAHEALIHRVDAELALGVVTPLDRELAADGVDEILTMMIAGWPTWGSFERDGSTIAVGLTDSDRSWQLTLGRFTGTSPNTGTEYDLDAATVDSPASDSAASISGTAESVDLWLWGRGDDVAIDGDPALVDRLRDLAAESTQ